MNMEKATVELIEKLKKLADGGKWHGTSWLDVVNEIDNRLSKIEAEGGGEDG